MIDVISLCVYIRKIVSANLEYPNAFMNICHAFINMTNEVLSNGNGPNLLCREPFFQVHQILTIISGLKVMHIYEYIKLHLNKKKNNLTVTFVISNENLP